MEDTQLMKGILEGCVLSIIARGETYGYEILAELERYGFEELGEGTLYPILTRLDKNGCISCRKAKSPLGPIRKYYSVTEEGKKRLSLFLENYRKVTKCAEAVLFETGTEMVPLETGAKAQGEKVPKRSASFDAPKPPESGAVGSEKAAEGRGSFDAAVGSAD